MAKALPALDEIARFAVEIARGAGAILARYYEQGGVAVSRKGAIDLVTPADRDAERYLLDAIGKRFPTHAVLAEASAPGRRDGPYRWICDPLDGTTNLAHGVPHFAVLIAVQRRLGPGR